MIVRSQARLVAGSCEKEFAGADATDELSREAVAELVESDASLVPQERSAFLVEPKVLEPEEVAALLVRAERRIIRGARSGPGTDAQGNRDGCPGDRGGHKGRQL